MENSISTLSKKTKHVNQTGIFLLHVRSFHPQRKLSTPRRSTQTESPPVTLQHRPLAIGRLCTDLPGVIRTRMCGAEMGPGAFLAKDPSIGNKMINARAETVAEKPSFRKAFKQQRCLVIADGFYEWKREGKAKQPYYIRVKDHRMFCFAGLWERWEKDKDGPLETCAKLTIRPNAVMEPIHHRMPVILQPHDYDMWLDPHIQDKELLSSLLQPYPPNEMEAFLVSTMVNNPKNDSEQCIQPVE